MPWCPVCKVEYEPGVAVCADCGAALVAELPSHDEREPVIVLEAQDVTEAQIAEATLQAEGIDAFIGASSDYPTRTIDPLTGVGAAVLVAAEDEARAREILAQPSPTDAELDALAEVPPDVV